MIFQRTEHVSNKQTFNEEPVRVATEL